MQTTKKRDHGDYFKKRRARLKAEREALEQKVAGEWHPTKERTDPGVALSETLLVRISPTMMACIDYARRDQLFIKSRSEWARNALEIAINKHVPRDVQAQFREATQPTT